MGTGWVTGEASTAAAAAAAEAAAAAAGRGKLDSRELLRLAALQSLLWKAKVNVGAAELQLLLLKQRRAAHKTNKQNKESNKINKQNK